MTGQKLIRGRWVFTGDEVLHDGAVVVDKDRIVDAGPADMLLQKYAAANVLGSDQHAVLPGFVNAHHHSHGASAIQLGRPDALLEPWILGFAALRTGDRYLDTLLSGARQLRGGVTSVVDVHSGGGSAASYERKVDAVLRAYEEVGIRVALATGVSTQSHLVHGKDQDRAFLDHLPEALSAQAESLLPGPGCMTDAEYLDIVESRVRKFAAHPLIDVWFGPPGPQWVSDELMQRIAERADELDTNIQTHCNESFYEMLHGHRAYGCATVEHLERLGVLSPRFSLAHGVWLSEAELAVLARTGAAVSHNPSSNLRLRAGIAPLNALLAAGFPVALGMDGTTINEDEDMFNELRLALRLNRAPQLDVSVPSLQQVFAMATRGGARLMRKEQQIGRLASGCQADLLVLDLTRVTYPWVAPEADPLEVVLLRAKREDIKTVMVNGEVVMQDGVATGFDEAAAVQALVEHLRAQTVSSERAALVEALTPHLEAWYREWETPALRPFTTYNAR